MQPLDTSLWKIGKDRDCRTCALQSKYLDDLFWQRKKAIETRVNNRFDYALAGWQWHHQTLLCRESMDSSQAGAETIGGGKSDPQRVENRIGAAPEHPLHNLIDAVARLLQYSQYTAGRPGLRRSLADN
ncbi:MAG TPA: hypothetical protein VG297_15995 [Bryobacteraceae bacterium]|jgi:hypothetical protein|nr:hypothetical protein [Bryobacteraceae bacterium]